MSSPEPIAGAAAAPDDLAVSVVIPTYDRAHTLARAIDSVLAQTRPAAEVLVVDDGSTDGTEALVAGYGARVRYLRQANAGVSAARNTGVRAARGPLIAFLDSDDFWLPDKLARQVPPMADPDVAVCFTNRTWTSRRGDDRFGELGFVCDGPVRIVDDPVAVMAWPGGSPLIASCCLYRRADLLRVGGYDERLRVYEDLDLDFRVAFASRKFAAVREVLAVLDDSPTFAHLSAWNWAFFCRATDAAVGTYTAALARAGDRSRTVRRHLRRALAHHLTRQAERLAVEGDRRAARARSWACLRLWPGPRAWLRSAVGCLAPGWLAARSAWRRVRSAPA